MSDPATKYLTITHPHGTREWVPIGTPGKGLRLAVGSPDRRSSTWRASARRSDVYITASGLGKSVKMSLHESGVWRIAFLSAEHAVQEGALGLPKYNNDPRVLDRWEEPATNNGWMHALSVWVPHGQLTPLPELDPKKPITWLAEPAAGEVVGIHFVVARPDGGVLNMPAGMRFVAGFYLPNRRGLFALSSRVPLDPSRARYWRDACRLP